MYHITSRNINILNFAYYEMELIYHFKVHHIQVINDAEVSKLIKTLLLNFHRKSSLMALIIYYFNPSYIMNYQR